MSLRKNLGYNLISNILNIITPLITAPYTARVLGVDNIGISSFTTTYAAYFLLFVYLGIPLYGIREIGKTSSQTERNRIVSELFRIMSITTVIFSIIYVGSIYTIPKLYDDRYFLLVSGAALIFAPFNMDWYFTGRERLKVVTLRNLAVKVACIAGIFTLVRDRDDIIIYLILNVAVMGLSQFWNFCYMLKSEVTLLWHNLDIHRHIRPVTTLFLTSLAISVYTMLDTLMLGFLSTDNEIGFYSAAIRISKLLIPIVTATASVVIPRISMYSSNKNYEGLNKIANSSFSYISLLAPPLAIGLAVVAPSFIPMFFGEEFVGAILPTMTLSMVIILISGGSYFGVQGLVSTGNEQRYTTAVIVGMIANFLLNIALIPNHGAIGASVASVVAELFVTSISIYYVAKLVPSFIPRFTTLRNSVVSSLPIVIYGYLFTHLLESQYAQFLFIVLCSVATFGLIQLFIFKDSEFVKLKNSIFVKETK